MSIASKIRDYMTSIPPGEGFTPFDMEKAATDLRMPRAKLSSHMSAMSGKGKVELVRDDQKRIIGFTAVHMEDRRKTSKIMGGNRKAAKPVIVEAEAEPRPIRRLVQTPELERVYAARSAMAQFVEQFGALVDQERATASIRIDPEKVEAYASEGMALLERNQWLEKRNRDLRDENASLSRENGFLRAKQNPELRTALQTAGVVHGD